MINVLTYQPLIREVLTQLRIQSKNLEDMEQECYQKLLENLSRLEAAVEFGTDKSFAAVICRNHVRDLLNKEHQYKNVRKIRFDSLSDPKILHKAMKVRSMYQFDDQERELEEAMLSVPYEEYAVLHSLFVEEKTQEQTAKDMGVTRREVLARRDKGIQNLKKYFGVE